MPRDASRGHGSEPPTPYDSAAGSGREWDTPPRPNPSSSSALTRAHTRSTRGRTPAATSNNGQLVKASDYKPVYSKYRQEILTEEEYISNLSDIIKRDFFPQLYSLDQRRDIIRGLESQDEHVVQQSMLRMRELCTPMGFLPRSTRKRNQDTTPSTRAHDETPTAFDQTPLTAFSATPDPARRDGYDDDSGGRLGHIDSTLSLDAFQSRYTSQDNSSFATLLARDNELRREKTRWAWQAERRANDAQVRGRRARERLVDVTRDLIEQGQPGRGGDGTVWLLEGGAAGKPGERQVLVGKGTKMDGDDDARGLLLMGRDEKERLRITAGTQGEQKLILGADGGKSGDKGKGKAIERVDERAQQYIDWDRPAVEEEEANKPIEKRALQVGVQTWPFKNRNSLMFPPDADADPSDPPPLQHASSASAAAGAAASASNATSSNPVLPLGEPKGIRYHATRLMDLERGEGRLDDGSEGGTPSPSRSRINAAISGTPYPGSDAADLLGSSSTPRVNNFSFVSALPSPRAHQLGPQALQELMTWGSIEATPVTVRGSNDRDASVGPFRIEDTSRREELAFKLANKAKRSLAESAHGKQPHRSGRGGGGLALDVRPTPSPGSQRRGGILGSVRNGAHGRGASASSPSGSITPRTGDHLSPAARSLLSKTKPGKMLDRSLRVHNHSETVLRASAAAAAAATTEGEKRRRDEAERIERAKKRAREVESQDRLKRERWTPSPAVSLGFDPDLEEQRFLPKHGRVG